ncbi:MAG: DUF1295 domain-containing protein [Tannerellaceae bacterium]|nr:DUF1295 domain-containing protein [Tannerellaceae bacterium]
MGTIKQTIYQSRKTGFLIIFLTYIIALGIAIFTFQSVNPDQHLLWRLFLADFAATVFVWFIGMIFDNASLYDPYWSVAPPLLLTLLAIKWYSVDIPFLLLLTGVWIWAIRLTVNWGYTFKNLGIQDWRYDKYKQQFPILWQLVNFTGINLMPTIIVFLAMIPGIYLLELCGSANLFTIIGFLICTGAATLQYFADRQIHRFRKTNPGKVCNIGLWSFSRHPNYLGEIAMWWGVFIMLLSIGGKEYTWTGTGALVNSLLFIFISIPLMEKRQLANKAEYATYRKQTGMLLPKIK